MFLVAEELEQICIYGPQKMASEAWTDSLMVQERHEILHHISQVRMCIGSLRMSVQFSANGNVELIKEVMMIVMMKGSGIRNPYYGS